MPPEDTHPMQNDAQMRQVNLLDYVVVMAQYKRFIVRFVGACVVIGAVLLFLILPRWYKSTAVVMPPKQKMNLGLITSLARATAPLRGLGLGQASDDISNLQAILMSRRVMEAVIDRFDLRAVYDVDTLDKALDELESNTVVTLGKEDVSIELSVYDTDPSRAAEMANYYIQMLNKVYMEMSVVEARANRVFIEQRYLKNIRELEAAEESFKQFQEKYGVYSVPDQVKAAVEAAATLESRIALKEVQQGILTRTTSDENPVRQSVELEIRELRHQLDLMKTGSGKQGASLVFPPFAKTPEIGIEYFRHFREVEMQGKILELVLPMYEQAKIEEQRDTPSVLVLDTAKPAYKASKPKRLILMAVILIGSFIVAYVIAMIMDTAKRKRLLRTDAEAAKIALVKQELSLKNLLR
jgi:tyrosine-protein kinase Etk/Wzc